MGVVGDKAKEMAKKEIKKRAVKILIGAVGSAGPILLILFIVILVFGGIAAAFSMKDNVEQISIHDVDDIYELREALKDKRIKDEDLDDMMIDRRGLLRILDCVIEWNEGKWLTSDRLKITLKETTDDYYVTTGIVSKDFHYSERVDGYEHGGTNSGTGYTDEYIIHWIPISDYVLLDDGSSDTNGIDRIDYNYRPGNNKKQKMIKEVTVRKIPVLVSDFMYLYSQVVKADGSISYKKDRNGTYVRYDAPGGYIPIRLDSISHIHEWTETKYESYTTQHYTTFGTVKKDEISRTPVLDVAYVSKTWESAAKEGPDWDIVIATEDLYRDYPVDWQSIYLFAVYKYIDDHDLEEVESDYDEDEGLKTVKIKKSEVEELIERCMPQFKYKSSIFNALLYNAMAFRFDQSVMKSLTMMFNVWYQKNISLFNSLNKSGLKIKLTAPQVQSLFTGENDYGTKLLYGGSPITVNVFWTKDEENVRLVNGKPRSVIEPVVHKSTILVPYSTLESVSTLTAVYNYGPVDITKKYTFDVTDEHNQDGEDLSGVEELEYLLSDMATQRTSEVVSNRYDLTGLRALLNNEEDRDIDMFVTAVQELPGGEDIAAAINCAVQYENSGLSIEEAIKKYNEVNETKAVEGIGGTKTDRGRF